MTNLFMLSREVRRVPLDFDAPLNETWEPLMQRPSGDFPPCPTCGPPSNAYDTIMDKLFPRTRRDGDGLTPAARQLSESWYALGVQDDAVREIMRWDDKLTQDEVDHLVAEGRLPTWVVPEGAERARWEQLPRVAVEVNACQRAGAFGSHDAINQGIALRYRCEKLGIEMECPTCKGHGDMAADEERKAAEEWEFPSVPVGPGWQMWETVSEGSPITPVFESPEELAGWCAKNSMGVAGHVFTEAEWMRVIEGKASMIEVGTGALV